jgi:hypothetical protein
LHRRWPASTSNHQRDCAALAASARSTPKISGTTTSWSTPPPPAPVFSRQRVVINAVTSGAHHCHPPTTAEVDGDVEDAGANGAVKDDNVGDKDDAGKFFAMELIQRLTGGQRQQCPQVIVQRIVPRSIFDDMKTMAMKSYGRLVQLQTHPLPGPMRTPSLPSLPWCLPPWSDPFLPNVGCSAIRS